MSPSRNPPSEKETLFTPFQIQIKEKEKPVKLIVQACFAEKIKAEGRVTFQNMFSSMADFRDVVSMLPTLCRAFFFTVESALSLFNLFTGTPSKYLQRNNSNKA